MRTYYKELQEEESFEGQWDRKTDVDAWHLIPCFEMDRAYFYP